MESVAEFHRATGHLVNEQPIAVSREVAEFRHGLIKEEIDELRDAFAVQNIIEMADALADIMYVVCGACLTFGIPLDTSVASFGIARKSNDESQAGQSLLAAVDGMAGHVNDRVIAGEHLTHTDELSKQYRYIIAYLQTFAEYVGVDLNGAFAEVHRSNMTKLCSTETEAQQTVEHYRETQTKYTNPSYKQSPNGVHWVVFDDVPEKPKVLKNMNWTKPDLQQFVIR